MVSKKELKELFTKDWKKHYQIEALTSKGFRRKQCKSCGNFFWTLDSEREKCADASCVGYDFIGRPTKKYSYTETWEEIAKYFTKHGHTEIKRYPTVCRWREDLYFTNASIIDFQPYVVSGEVEAPANPLIVPQTSIRFGDLDNVGLTGRHYTCFVMFGQHAFNSKKTGQFYWKDEAIEHDFQCLTKVLGAKKEEIVFQEEVWAGGGNFGPCMEYCVSGVELGNIVFMQYKELENGKFEELKTKVIDMGAGLERFAWFTNGTPTSYEVTFGPVIEKMKKETGIELEKKLFTDYARYSGLMDAERQNLEAERKEIAKRLGLQESYLFGKLRRLQALYSIADHLKCILYTCTDGMLPSNSGGGYNLRMILRRVFGFNQEFQLGLDFAKLVELHAKQLEGFDETVKEGVPTAIAVIAEEQKKFLETKEKGKKKVEIILEKSKREHKSISTEELITLYESDGIPAEMVEEIAAEKGLKLEVPQNFYSIITKKNEVPEEKTGFEKDLSRYPKTKTLFHEDPYLEEFTAKVLGVEESCVILDATAFYAEAGGQECDTGILNETEVSSVQNFGGVIVHEVKQPQRFKEGQKVFGKIDWKRRLALMQHHTGTHVLNAACRELLGKHIWQAGASKEQEKAHLDVTHYKKISPEELREIELLANSIIQRNLPVKKTVLDRTKAEQKYGFRIYQGGFVPGKELRIVEILGIDVQACGGTHLNFTGEIGLLKILKRESVQDGVERLTFACGLNALREVQKKEEILRKSAEVLSVPEIQLSESASKFFQEWKDRRKEIESLQNSIAGLAVENLKRKEKNGKIAAFVDGLDAKTLLVLATRLSLERPQALIVLASGKEEADIATVSGTLSGKNALEETKHYFQQCRGLGGGNASMSRGRIKDVKRLKEMLKE